MKNLQMGLNSIAISYIYATCHEDYCIDNKPQYQQLSCLCMYFYIHKSCHVWLAKVQWKKNVHSVHDRSAWRCINDLHRKKNIWKSFFKSIFCTSIFYILSLFFFYLPVSLGYDEKKITHSHTEAEKRPLKRIVARAGTNLTLPCNALNEKSISKIEKLTWKLSQTIIAKYSDGKPLDHQNNRVR